MYQILEKIILLILAPSILYGSYMTMYLLYLLFNLRKVDFKEELREWKLSEEKLEATKNLFWFAYTPLFVVALLTYACFFNTDDFGYGVLSIIGYVLAILLTGYLPKRKKE